MWKRRLSIIAFALLTAAGASSPVAAEPSGGTLVPVAGTGTPGSSGDGGPATQATLNTPLGVVSSRHGTLFVADAGNHRVRAVGTDGMIRTVAGSGQDGIRPAPVPAGAKATDIALSRPASLAVGPDGTLYIADLVQARVYAVTDDGTITVRAGQGAGGGPADPPMGPPTGLAVAADGTLYVADHDNNRVLAVAPDGKVVTVAGNGQNVAQAAGGPAVEVPVGSPDGLAVDAHGDLWISGGLLLRRLHDHRIATVTAPDGGTWTTDAAPTWPPAHPPLNDVTTVSAGADGLYTIDLKQHTVRRLGSDGTVTQVVAVPAETFGALGPVALSAQATAGGRLYIVDTEHGRVYTVDAPPAANPAPGGKDAPVWPYILGGAVLLVLVAAGLLLARRRRTGTP